MTLNELSNALWARNVTIHISGQRNDYHFKSIAAACEKFGSYSVLGSCSTGDCATCISVEVP